MKKLKLSIFPIFLSIFALNLTACAEENKGKKFIASENYTFTYSTGNEETLKNCKYEGIQSEQEVFNKIVGNYTSNSFGKLGYLYLSNEASPKAMLDGKEVQGYAVNYTHKSDFEEVSSGYVDPVTSLCDYILDSDGTLHFYSSRMLLMTMSYEYSEYEWGGSTYTIINNVSSSMGYKVFGKNLKIEKNILKSTFTFRYAIDDNLLVEADVYTEWNLIK